MLWIFQQMKSENHWGDVIKTYRSTAYQCFIHTSGLGGGGYLAGDEETQFNAKIYVGAGMGRVWEGKRILRWRISP